MTTCRVSACHNRVVVRDLCDTHRRRELAFGDPELAAPLPGDVARRYWVKVEQGSDDECWPWRGYRARFGYGRFLVEGKVGPAHRTAWLLTFGPIPPGIFVCHHCDNPPCCNPAYLFLGTALDNNRDRASKGRSVPARGTRNASNKLSEDDVRAIRQRLAVGGESHRGLAEEYGVGKTIIGSIATGKKWGWLS